MFTHLKDGAQVWVLGIINNKKKNFVIQPSKFRDSNTLNNFIKEYIKPGNTIVHDGWAGHNFIRDSDDYEDITHNHGNGPFGSGITSTSYIESLWHSLKSKILGTYKQIPCKYLLVIF